MAGQAEVYEAFHKMQRVALNQTNGAVGHFMGAYIGKKRAPTGDGMKLCWVLVQQEGRVPVVIGRNSNEAVAFLTGMTYALPFGRVGVNT